MDRRSETGERRFVYGPVPSRRLGLSLGLSVVPAKTCTLDCGYCQVGLTTDKTITRRSYYPVAAIIDEVAAAVEQARPDYITFSGEGEPTLNRDIGTLIRRLKRRFRIPVAVITNGTLLYRPDVRRDLLACDLVVPSLDAADQRVFARVNRNHSGLSVERMIDGLARFRRQYRGQLWLEVMLVKGVNDAPEHVARLRQAAWRIRPDRVQLNTVVRPPADRRCQPLTGDDLEQVALLFGPGTDVVSLPRARRRGRAAVSEDAILATVRGRPVTEQDLCWSLGYRAAELRPVLGRLVRAGKVRRTGFGGRVFYEPADRC